jgi:hydroxymethylglutaryl-CoA reductase
MSKQPSSRIPGFYARRLDERLALVEGSAALSPEALALLRHGGGLDLDTADRMSENVIACHGLPLALALNFRVNQRDYLVPMAIEEPSVVAAASNAARLLRISGGFTGDADPPIMTAQIQLDAVPAPETAPARLAAHREAILALGDAAIPRMVARGGGCRDLEVRVLEPASGMVAVHVYVDVGDAMGANLVDTVAEAVAPEIASVLGGSIGLRILSNLPLRRLVRVRAEVSAEAVGGERLADAIARASHFASCDPLRAATHNKGIMNGIDAVALALGQDWRAIEAGAHAYAALGGSYRPLATWQRTAGGIAGALEMPLAVGCVGGATQVHRGVRAAFELLGTSSARELAVVMAAAGLASNLAALRALCGEGIQRGHMRLHRRRLETQPAETDSYLPQQPGRSS